MAVVRAGSVAGEHQVVLATEGERIVLQHSAESRELFAHGLPVDLDLQLRQFGGDFLLGSVLGLRRQRGAGASGDERDDG